MNFIEKYAYRQLFKKLAETKRKVVLPNPESLKKVGVIWQPHHSDAYRYLHDHFLHTKVIFRNLCVYENGVSALTTSNAISKKDLNWLGLPRPGTYDNFIETEFDVLFNIALEQNFLLDYTTAICPAKFKIGWSQKEKNFFDLNINIGPKADALYLAKQQIFYLGELNKTKST